MGFYGWCGGCEEWERSGRRAIKAGACWTNPLVPLPLRVFGLAGFHSIQPYVTPRRWMRGFGKRSLGRTLGRTWEGGVPLASEGLRSRASGRAAVRSRSSRTRSAAHGPCGKAGIRGAGRGGRAEVVVL